MTNICNISLVGVGGQGILLTSDILARTAALAGFEVKKSEIHGMAQRGGSVISQVRFGDQVFAPIIPDGQSDVLVAFERLEALRWRHLLNPQGQIIINDMNLTPVTVSSGQQAAITNLDARIATQYPQAILLDALKIANQLGTKRVMNMVLAGALSRLTTFAPATWQEAMQARIPAKLLDLNLKAFDLGRQATANT